MIELETLKELFAGVRAKTKWNIDGPMLWGYFFTDGEEGKLKNAATHLAGQGYRFVDIHETDDSSMRVLHVERVETHSPESLFARNAELYRVAETFGLDSYDGMDVGPVTNN